VPAAGDSAAARAQSRSRAQCGNARQEAKGAQGAKGASARHTLASSFSRSRAPSAPESPLPPPPPPPPASPSTTPGGGASPPALAAAAAAAAAAAGCGSALSASCQSARAQAVQQGRRRAGVRCTGQTHAHGAGNARSPESVNSRLTAAFSKHAVAGARTIVGGQNAGWREGARCCS
jgi:hypothetical protein